MPEFQLIAEPALSRLDRRFGRTRLWEVPGLALVSVALPRGGEEAAQTAFLTAYGASLPSVGRYVVAPDDGALMIRTSLDQGMIAFEHARPDAGRIVTERLGKSVYVTDQTDAWVGLELEGPAASAALERLCPLDLHMESFGLDAALRTLIDHLGVLLLRRSKDAFLLLSARSSCVSFAHAIETAIVSVT